VVDRAHNLLLIFECSCTRFTHNPQSMRKCPVPGESMIRKWFQLIPVCAVVFLIPSCGHDQQLVGIDIQPTTEVFGSPTTPVSADAGLNVQLRALGSFIHPPVTKDITNQVTWSSNTPQMVTVNSTGLITATGDACGGTIISATVTKNSSDGGISSAGAVVTGNMTASVVCPTGP
jgi:hypothetical protein